MSTYRNIPSVLKPNPARYYANTVFEDIKQHIKDIRYSIRDDEDMVAIVPLGDGSIITLYSLGYKNPNFIIVIGTDNQGNYTHALIPHMSIQVIMKILKKEPGKPRHAIGFLSPDSPQIPTSDV